MDVPPLLRVVGYPCKPNDELFDLATQCGLADYTRAKSAEDYVAAVKQPAKIVYMSAHSGEDKDGEPLLKGGRNKARVAAMHPLACEGAVLFTCWSGTKWFWTRKTRRSLRNIAVLANDRGGDRQIQNTNGRPVLEALIAELEADPSGDRTATDILEQTRLNADSFRPGLNPKIVDAWLVLDPRRGPKGPA